jgi:hypothetical protein
VKIEVSFWIPDVWDLVLKNGTSKTRKCLEFDKLFQEILKIEVDGDVLKPGMFGTW